MILRKEYIELLNKWREENVIKVVTGIRRSGKSTLFKQFAQCLKEQGVEDNQIFFINFEELDYDDLLDYKALYHYLCERLNPDKMNYIFLDEIQKVDFFEKVVDSLYIKDNVDIFITGSNAYLLSGELATLLSGRYVEINMLPLSFLEYSELNPSVNIDTLFSDYMKFGGMPYVAKLNNSEEKTDMYLEGIYNTIIIKDIEERQRSQDVDKRKVTDIVLLKNIAKFLAGSVGSLISIKSIADYITSTGRKVSPNTINDYVDALIEPYIFYPVQRFDVVGKQLLKTNQKLYVADLGIRNHILFRKNYDLGYSLENIVYLELLRRRYKVSVGKVENKEIDFVAQKNNRIEYYQVTASLIEESTFNREMTPLKMIPDNYPKTIITLDRLTTGDYDGIRVVNAIDWLCKKIGE